MKIALKRIRYNTMNSWNQSTAPAFNLKVYNVIPREYRDKAYEMMDAENFYDDINWMIRDFGESFNFSWQAGFNGRSGGYLVLYKGGKREDGQVYSQPGMNIEDSEVPKDVMKAFSSLAHDIVKLVVSNAKTATVKTETYTVKKQRKVLVLA